MRNGEIGRKEPGHCGVLTSRRLRGAPAGRVVVAGAPELPADPRGGERRRSGAASRGARRLDVEPPVAAAAAFRLEGGGPVDDAGGLLRGRGDARAAAQRRRRRLADAEPGDASLAVAGDRGQEGLHVPPRVHGVRRRPGVAVPCAHVRHDGSVARYGRAVARSRP